MVDYSTVKCILDQDTEYPYIIKGCANGLTIMNNHPAHEVIAEITANEEKFIIHCTSYVRCYSGDFKNLQSINIISGTTYQIELRGNQ